MKRLSMTTVMIFVPALAWAQVMPPVPVPPPAPPAPMVMQMPPVPPVPPPAPPTPKAPATPWPMPAPVLMPVEAWHIDQDALRHQIEQAKFAAEDARLHLQDFKLEPFHFEPFHFEYQDAFSLVRRNDGYDSAMSLLDRREYDRAVAAFDQVIAQKSPRADGATYWKAFALHKLGKSAEARAAIDQLEKNFDKSKYIKEGKALDALVRQSSGQPARLDEADSDELKLLAIQSMSHQDPERAIPLLEGVINAANSNRVKSQALYVLAGISHPRSREVLMSIAKGSSTPDLQRKAISYIAQRRGSTSAATATELKEIYDSVTDADIKRTIISAYGSARATTSLVAVATSTEPALLRTSAVSQLSNLRAQDELWAIYQKEQDRDLRLQIISAFGSMGATEKLTEVLKVEKDPELRRRALRSFGSMRVETSGTMLTALYASESDLDNKKTIISSLASQNNAEALVAIARKETNLTLKRDIVSRLSSMTKNKVAMDYMMEIIK